MGQRACIPTARLAGLNPALFAPTKPTLPGPRHSLSGGGFVLESAEHVLLVAPSAHCPLLGIAGRLRTMAVYAQRLVAVQQASTSAEMNRRDVVGLPLLRVAALDTPSAVPFP